MRQIVTSPFPSGGRNPVAEAVSPDEADLYVVNRDDNSIVQFVIGTDGKLYPQNTVNTPGIFPLAVTVCRKFLYVVDTYQPLPTCNPASPCSGSVAVFPILNTAAGSRPQALSTGKHAGNPRGEHQHQRQLLAPLAVGHSCIRCVRPHRSHTLPLAPMSTSPATIPATNLGYVFGFTTGSDGTLTAIPGFPVAVGTHPSAIASDASGAYLYVTDSAQNLVYGFQINGGALTASGGSPFRHRRPARPPSCSTLQPNTPWSQTDRTPT